MTSTRLQGRPAPARRRWMLGMALAGAALVGPGAGTAQASPFSVLTTGTILSGTNPGNIAGLGTSLAGDSYSLLVATGGLDPSYFSDAGLASDSTLTIPGAITVTANGVVLTTGTLSAIAFSAQEDIYGDLSTTASGLDAAGNFAAASQSIEANSSFVTSATLQTPFAYTLAPGDIGSDSYSFSNPADTATLGFTGAPATVSLQVPVAVPEPASWAMLGAGLLGLAVLRRRRA